MFGIIRPCRHGLPGELRAAWWAHLCGLCLALRDEHGQLARLATNHDGLVVSALLAAQLAEPQARAAGPCPLRGMRGARVAVGPGARLAAVASLLLASAKLADHVADGDGPRLPGVATRVAARWSAQGLRTAGDLDFDAGALTGVAQRQAVLEAAARPGSSVLAVTEPAEQAVAAVFAHTAALAGRPHNAAPLAEAGRLFGRAAHLLDAVEDLAADTAGGGWNPLTATGTGLRHARRLCDDAVTGVALALRDVDLVPGTDAALVRRLLVHELRHAVRRTAAAADGASGQHDPRHPGPGHVGPGHPGPEPGRPRGPRTWLALAGGCLAGAVSACSCGLCCRESADGCCQSCGDACGEACGRACRDGCNSACADCECGRACADCGQGCDSCGRACGDCGSSCGDCGSSCGDCGDCGSSCSCQC